MAQSSGATGPVSLPKRILVPVDGSEESFTAASYAIELSGKLKAELSVLHVILIPEYISQEAAGRLVRELGSRGESALKRVREIAHGKQVKIHEKMLTTTKSVITTICECATNEGAELIVMGRSGAGGVAKLMLGTVAAGVVREAHCPVLTVR